MASDEVEESDYTPRTFWGWVAATTVVAPGSWVTVGAWVVNGVIHHQKGGEFKDGMEKPTEYFAKVCQKAAKWGDENGDFLTKTAIGAAVAVITGRKVS